MKILLLISFTFILALSSFGQFGSQTAANTQEQPANKAVVYIYAPKAPPTLGRIKKPVFFNGRKIADIQLGRYFIALVPPDLHGFNGISKNYGGVKMEFEAGKTYYLQFNWAWGGTVEAGGITSVQSELGAAALKEMRLIDEKNIKDKRIVVLIRFPYRRRGFIDRPFLLSLVWGVAVCRAVWRCGKHSDLCPIQRFLVCRLIL